MLFQVPLGFRILFSWKNSYPKEDKIQIYVNDDEKLACKGIQSLLVQGARALIQ